MLESLPDIPRLFTALAEWGAALVYVTAVARASSHDPSPARPVPRWRLALAAAGGLPAFAITQELLGRAPLSLWVPGMVLAFALVWGTIRIGTAMDWRWVTHTSARAFVVAELAASLAWQVVVYFHATAPIWRPEALGGFTAIAAACLGTVHYCERRVLRQGALPPLRRGDLVAALVIGVAVFALSNLSFVSTQTPFSGRAGLEVFYIRTLVDLGGYAILFAQFERIQQSAMERELASIQASLEAQHHQYLSARADMEQVARAHHDLKHQVAAIRAELDPGAGRRLLRGARVPDRADRPAVPQREPGPGRGPDDEGTGVRRRGHQLHGGRGRVPPGGPIVDGHRHPLRQRPGQRDRGLPQSARPGQAPH